MTLGVDDYPYRGQSSGIDPWNMTKGQCTSLCAWRINHDLHVEFDYRTHPWGNADTWANDAVAQGIPVDGNPRRGDIAVFTSGVDTASSVGHVAVVLAVNGSRALVEDYNWYETSSYLQHWVGIPGLRFVHFAPLPAPPPVPVPTPPLEDDVYLIQSGTQLSVVGAEGRRGLRQAEVDAFIRLGLVVKQVTATDYAAFTVIPGATP